MKNKTHDVDLPTSGNINDFRLSNDYFDYEEVPSLKKELLDETISWLKTIAYAVVFALFLGRFVIANAEVPTGSMADIIQPSDRIIAIRFSYLLTIPRRYDIVVFRNPDEESYMYVKRVIGLPGETIEIRNGQVYINSLLQPEAAMYARDTLAGSWGPRVIPENSFFVLGDNRNNSIDSRNWINPFVERRQLVGRAFLRYMPLDNIAILQRH